MWVELEDERKGTDELWNVKGAVENEPIVALDRDKMNNQHRKIEIVNSSQ